MHINKCEATLGKLFDGADHKCPWMKNINEVTCLLGALRDLGIAVRPANLNRSELAFF